MDEKINIYHLVYYKYNCYGASFVFAYLFTPEDLCANEHLIRTEL